MRTIQQIEYDEKSKYEQIWEWGDYKSPAAFSFAMKINLQVDKDSRCLDIGCGDGTTVEALSMLGKKVTGVDITLEGVANKELHGIQYYEAPVWDMPFKDDEFDITFSTDVLEHIPRIMIGPALAEIGRITKIKTIHQICTKPAVRDYCGHKVHLTVKPIDWWKHQFIEYIDKDINCIISPI